jgi:hypothetical protein
MWGVPVDLAVEVTEGQRQVIVTGPKGDLVVLEPRMWRSRECGMNVRAWRERVEALLWNEGNPSEIAAAIVPDAWFASRDQLRVAHRHVIYAVRVMRARGLRTGLDGFLRILDPHVLGEIAEFLSESRVRLAVDAYLDSVSSSDLASLTVVLERLRSLL